MPQYRRHYTVQQAKTLLPWVKEKLERAQFLIKELEKAQVAMQEIQRLIRSNGKGSGHPDFGSIIGEIQSIIGEFVQREIEIKDLNKGLIDFPHYRGRDEVYLCYLLGEEDINFWHTFEEGFGGRQEV